MPIVKISLTEKEYKELKKLADNSKLTIQDYMRSQLLSITIPSVFNPEEAVKRALTKFKKGERFTLPNIYDEEWHELTPRMTGVFGKRFFNYVKKINDIEYIGPTSDGRRSLYKIV